MSSITEGVMTAGRFTINMDDSAPRSFVERITPFSFLCVLPGRCDGLTAADVFASAIYSGVVRRYSDRYATIEGASLLTLLGDEDGKGTTSSRSVDGTGGADQMIIDLFGDSLVAFPFATNGISLGSTASLPSSAVYARMFSTSFGDDYTETPRAFLDRVCRFFDWQYRVKPNGEADVEVRGSLFRSTPSVCVIADYLGEPVSDVLRLVLAGRIDATISYDDFASSVNVTDQTYFGTGYAPGTLPYSFSLSSFLHLTKYVNGVDLGSNGDAADQADFEIANTYKAKNEVSVSVAVDDPRSRIEPGDIIHVYDPLSGLEDLGTQINLMGQPIFPIELEVSEMTYPVAEGMGVYLVLNDRSAVWDLSEFVLWGSGETQLTVGARPTRLSEIVNRKN